jgi:hypothetical protein
MRFTLVLTLACPFLVADSFAAGDPQTGGAADAQTQAAAVLGGTTDRSHTYPPVTIGAEPDATLDLTGGSVAIGVGYVWGSGDLVYNGAKHKFKVRGVSVVDVGAAHLAASGVVYNLKQLEDFAGAYSAVTAGATVGAGGSAALLQNEHGVVIRLLSTTAGLRFNLAGNGISVRLAQ